MAGESNESQLPLNQTARGEIENILEKKGVKPPADAQSAEQGSLNAENNSLSQSRRTPEEEREVDEFIDSFVEKAREREKEIESQKSADLNRTRLGGALSDQNEYSSLSRHIVEGPAFDPRDRRIQKEELKNLVAAPKPPGSSENPPGTGSGGKPPGPPESPSDFFKGKMGRR